MPQRLICPNPKCGYDLTGVRTNRCPECGWEFDLVSPGKSQDSTQMLRLLARNTALLLAAPAVYLLTLFLAMTTPVGPAGSSVSQELVLLGGGWLAFLVGVAASFYVGWRVSQRLSPWPRRDANPARREYTAAVAYFLAFSVLFLLVQCALAFAVFFGACVFGF